MADRFVFTVTYVKTDLTSAVRQYLWRSLTDNTWASVIAVFAAVIGVGLLIFARRIDFMTGLFAGLMVAALLMLAFVALAHFRQMSAKLRAMKTPRAVFTLSDEGVAVETDRAAVRYAWDNIKQVWKFDRVWLLMFAANSFMTLPLAGAPAEALAFIDAKVQPRRL